MPVARRSVTADGGERGGQVMGEVVESLKPDELPAAKNSLVGAVSGRVVAGVVAALADRFGLDRCTVRLAFVLSLLLSSPQLPISVALWILAPRAERLTKSSRARR